MKISDAINILNIKNYTVYNIDNISYNELKKHYHIQCLIYHPDKNTNITNTTNTTLIFQNINLNLKFYRVGSATYIHHGAHGHARTHVRV